MQHPMRGKTVKPAIVMATGTSWLQGTAALTTRQQTFRHQRVSHVRTCEPFYSRWFSLSLLTVTLRIQDGATVIFTLASNHAKGDQARSAGLETEFTVAATDANLTRRTQGI